jgi:formiminotetrahydrofolate cyclodeaminase
MLPLWTGGVVSVESSAVMEVVTNHVLAKQKKDYYQDNYKQELSKSKRG